MPEKEQPDKLLGWDVGGTKSAAVVGTSDGKVLDRIQWPSEVRRGPEAMLEDFLGRADKLLGKHNDVGALGVSIGGPLNTLSGVIKSPPHLPGWDDIPLAEILRRRIDLPVVIEHDAAACLEAEWLWGAAKRTTHSVYLTCGTGCGAGIMIDKKILRGPDGQTPEVGHVRLAPDGPVMFGKAGCVESFCSGEGIAKLACEMFSEDFPRETDTARLGELASKGHGAARAVLAVSAKRTGQLCGLLADIFTPQVIVLGSLAGYLGQWWVEMIREEFVREALPANSRHTKIAPAALGADLQDLSAIAPCVYSSA